MEGVLEALGFAFVMFLIIGALLWFVWVSNSLYWFNRIHKKEIKKLYDEKN